MTGPHGEEWIDPDRLRAACEEAATFYARCLASVENARSYMGDRGWADLTRKGSGRDRWRPGYAPDRIHALVKHLRLAGFIDREILDAGLAWRARWGVADRFRDRIVFPLVDDRSVIGFAGRALPGADPDVPKWLNPPTTALYSKRCHLFGLAQNADRWAAGEVPVVVEGAGDAIAVGLAGRAAVSPLGTAFTREQLAALDRVVPPGRGMVVAFDADLAGRRALLRSSQLLLGRDVGVVTLPAGRDPGSYAAEGQFADLARGLSTPRALTAALIDARLDSWSRVLDHPAGQINAVRDVADLVIADPQKASTWITQVAASVRLPAGEVGQLVIEAMTNHVPRPFTEPTAHRRRGLKASVQVPTIGGEAALAAVPRCPGRG